MTNDPSASSNHIAAIEGDRHRFDPVTESNAMLAYLNTHGFVVAKSVASKKQVSNALDLFWSFLDDEADMKRGKPSTWTRFRDIASTTTGIIECPGVGQCDAAWFVRLLPKVKEVFAGIWRTRDLIVSFDRMNAFLPWHRSREAEKTEKTLPGWFHVDQGPSKSGRHCVQGLLSLKDATARTGGFTCVVASNRKFHDVMKCEWATKKTGDFVVVPPSDPILSEKKRLITCKAGDMILWDSRTIHCNSPALARPDSSPTELLRAVVYVCMTPREKASPDVLRSRCRGCLEFVTTSHWPHEFHPDRDTPSMTYDALSTREKQAVDLYTRAQHYEKRKQFGNAMRLYSKAYKRWPELENDAGALLSWSRPLSGALTEALHAMPEEKKALVGYDKDDGNDE